jgi:hypothetical protein
MAFRRFLSSMQRFKREGAFSLTETVLILVKPLEMVGEDSVALAEAARQALVVRPRTRWTSKTPFPDGREVVGHKEAEAQVAAPCPSMSPVPWS